VTQVESWVDVQALKRALTEPIGAKERVNNVSPEEVLYSKWSDGRRQERNIARLLCDGTVLLVSMS
jgi:hypothetical protein